MLPRNEKGSVLLLSLFMVLLLTLLMTPLLLSLSTGSTTSAKGGNWEQANYIAESGTSIARRALLEAVSNHNVSLNNDQISSFITDFKQNPPTLYQNAVSPEIRLDYASKSSNAKLYTKGTFGAEPVKRDKTLMLEIKTTQGNGSGETPNAGEGIFATNVVVNGTLNDSCNDQSNTLTCQNLYEKKMRQPDGQEIVSMNYKSNTFKNYEEEFMAYYNSVFQNKPKLLSPISPADVLEIPGSPYKSYEPVMILGNSEGQSTTKDIIIDTSDQNLTIRGDLITAGNIIIKSYLDSLTIEGDLYVKGKVIFNHSSSLKSFRVGGNMIVDGGFTDHSWSEFTVGGSISSQKEIYFKKSQTILIGGSILAGGSLQFDQLAKLTVGDSISAKGKMVFQGGIKTIEVKNGSILSGADIQFTSSINEGIQVSNNISAATDIIFSGNLTSATIQKGSLIAGNQLIFSNVATFSSYGSFSAKYIGFRDYYAFTNLTIHNGSIISEGDINLIWMKNVKISHDISGANIVLPGQTDIYIGGSIYASGTLRMSYTRGLTIGGSIYAGSGKGKGGIINTGNLENVKIHGAVLSTGDINLPYIVNTSIKSFIGSLGTLTIHQTSGNGSLQVGGITAGNGVKAPEWNQDNSIQVGFFPPVPGQQAQKPTIQFVNWKNK